MIEKIIKDYIRDNLNIPCYLEFPIMPDPRFIIVEKTGGTDETYIRSGVIAVQSYAESMYEAAKLNEEIKKVMFNMAELNEICKVSLNSDYNYTDTAQKRYRYQAVFDITYY